MKGTLYKVGEDPVEVDVATKGECLVRRGNGLPAEPTIEWLYKTIGCKYVELVSLPTGDLWIDEEGKLNGAPCNDAATKEFGKHLFVGDFIAGNAIYFPRNQV